MKAGLGAIVFSAAALVMLLPIAADAHPHPVHDSVAGHGHEKTVMPLYDGIGIERTLLHFDAPADNLMPWGFVEGTVKNGVEGQPVAIKIYRDGVLAHLAQADVNPDGSYEYRFRVLGLDGDGTVRPFLGSYDVYVYKTVYLDDILRA